MISTALAATELRSPRLLLRAPTASLLAAVQDFEQRNRAHFAPWDPPLPPDFLSAEATAQRLERDAKAFAENSSYRYWLSPLAQPARVIGRVQLSQVARGPFQNALLGYSLDEAEVGRGLMQEALRAIITEMFGPRVRLHRLQAAVRPDNARSRAVLRALGFAQEGLSRRYLFIDGQWRDHEVYALLNPDWPQDLAP